MALVYGKSGDTEQVCTGWLFVDSNPNHTQNPSSSPGPTRVPSESSPFVLVCAQFASLTQSSAGARSRPPLRARPAGHCREVVTLRHVKGAIMLADILTKGTARAIFLELLSLLDSYSISGEGSLSSSSD